MRVIQLELTDGWMPEDAGVSDKTEGAVLNSPTVRVVASCESKARCLVQVFKLARHGHSTKAHVGDWRESQWLRRTLPYLIQSGVMAWI